QHLALRARPLDMRGLATDIADQTCKTAAQSRTRFVGHRRQLPWIHSQYSKFRDRGMGRAKRDPSALSREKMGIAALNPSYGSSTRLQLALALDHFRRKLEVGFAADAFEVVDQHRLAVGRRLGDADVARDHRLVDLFAHELSDVGDDLV